MATIIDELLVQLKADNSELLVAMKEVAQETKKATDTVAKSTDKMADSVEKNTKLGKLAFADFIGGFASGLALKALDAVSGAIKGAFNSIVTDSVAAAQEAEATAAKLGNAFRLIGVDAKSGGAALQELTDELVRTTAVGDDAVISVGATIATIAKLSGPELAKATQNAVDLSAALGIDLQTAATAVSKAANGQVESLGRLGIHLKSTGDKSIDAANAMAELEKRFGGSAAAAAGTFGGRMAQLANAFGEVQEAIGGVITTNPVILAGIKMLSDAFMDLSKWVTTNSSEISDVLSASLLGVMDLLGGLGVVINETIRFLEAMVNYWLLVGQVAVDSLQAIGHALMGNFSKMGDQFKESRERADQLFKVINGEGRLDGMLEGLGAVQNKFQEAFDRKKADDAKASINGVATETDKVKLKLVEASQAAIEFSQALAKKASDPFAEMNFRAEATKQALASELITFQEYYAQRYAIDAENLMIQRSLLDEARAANQISEEQYQRSLTELARQHALERNNIEAERTKFEKQQQEQRAQNLRSTMGTIATLQNSSNKELAAAGKAAAIFMATVDGQAAVVKALSAAPPPFNFALAGLVGAAVATNIAKIAGAQLAGGIDSVPGTGFKDNFPATLTPGERVVPRKTNEDLTQFLSERDAEPRTVINNSFNIQVMSSSDGEILIKTINDTLARGGQRLLA